MRNNLKKTIILTALLLFVFSIPANAASYKKAYRKTIGKLKYADSAAYSLIYIDNDKIPELVCYLGGGGGISIYSYKSGKVKCLTKKYINEEVADSGAGLPYWREGAGAFGFCIYYYIPKKNMLYNRHCHRHFDKYVDTFFKIKKGRFVLIESISHDTDGTEFLIRNDYKQLFVKGYSKKKILKKLK